MTLDEHVWLVYNAPFRLSFRKKVYICTCKDLKFFFDRTNNHETNPLPYYNYPPAFTMDRILQ